MSISSARFITSSKESEGDLHYNSPRLFCCILFNIKYLQFKSIFFQENRGSSREFNYVIVG